MHTLHTRCTHTPPLGNPAWGSDSPVRRVSRFHHHPHPSIPVVHKGKEGGEQEQGEDRAQQSRGLQYASRTPHSSVHVHGVVLNGKHSVRVTGIYGSDALSCLLPRVLGRKETLLRTGSFFSALCSAVILPVAGKPTRRGPGDKSQRKKENKICAPSGLSHFLVSIYPLRLLSLCVFECLCHKWGIGNLCSVRVHINDI